MNDIILTVVIFLILYTLSPVIITLVACLIYWEKPVLRDFSDVLEWLNNMPNLLRIVWPAVLLAVIYGVVKVF